MPQLTQSEIDKMRELVANFDAGQEPIKVVDLNNPPRLPYRFQKFPKMLYDLENSSEQKIVFVTVDSESELADLLADGWSETPPNYSEQREEHLSPVLEREASEAQAKIDAIKTKRAYNRKVA